MSALKTEDQGTIVLSQQDYLPILVESFLVDRRAQGPSPETINFYQKKLKYFQDCCEGQAITQLSQITADLIRRHILEISVTHNEGGVHACFRPLRTLLYWVESEAIMSFSWNNPMRRVTCLYLPPGMPVFACRQCHNLSYESRQKRDPLAKLSRKVDALLERRTREQPDIPPPADSHACYVTSEELRERSQLTETEPLQLFLAPLLLPDLADGRYRPKLGSWARKLAYLLHKGWEVDEIKAWSAGRRKLRNPRQRPPRREKWTSS